jgi:hypothetical protein
MAIHLYTHTGGISAGSVKLFIVETLKNTPKGREKKFFLKIKLYLKKNPKMIFCNKL